ncbi:MAG: hypothetical protein U1F48_20650 [Burkholderiales bacterium]
MDTTATPAAIASLVARHLVAPFGVLFLGWSATNLLILYYLDTVLEFAVLIVLVGRHVTGIGPAGAPTRPFHGPADWVCMSVAALFAAVLIGIPLGVPVMLVAGAFDVSWAELLDRTFLWALAAQAIASVSGAVQAHRMLLARSDDEHVLKHRAAFVFGRWLVVVMAIAIVPVSLLGRWLGGALLVAIYAGASVYFELFPGRALRWLNPKEARADEIEQAKTGARPRR